jgi:hypothetical protein
LVFATWRTSIAGGPNGSFIGGTPVSASAPSVTPWYATRRAIAFVRPGSPRARWT